MKEKLEYEEARVDIICFDQVDIITSSPGDTGPALGEEPGAWNSNSDYDGWTPF